MKTKFKDLLLYSLATIGVVALFISATQTQESHGTPESHVWEFYNSSSPFAINKKTGEVRAYKAHMTDLTRRTEYVVVKEIQ